MLRGLDAIAGVWLLYLLLAFSGAGVGPVAPWIAAAGGALLVAGWLALWRAGRGDGPTPARRLALAVVPAACLIVAALFLFGKPPHNPLFRLRFAASRPALAGIAESALIFRPSQRAQRVGLFWARIELTRRRVWFLTAGCAAGHRCGIVYAPGSRRPAAAGATFTGLDGPWYHLDERAR